ncbi:MAG: hypothetical protein IPP50_23615 [Piscinibacter sp.]|nr:hypothetical protein [Piscinibacter sp.]
MPPCINKYYILDLQPEIQWSATPSSKAFTVFLKSWRNPCL